MSTRLIVLIDFSATTEPLLKVANKWSRHLHTDIVLVHQLTLKLPAMADDETRRQILGLEKEEALAKLNELSRVKIASPAQVTFRVSERSLQFILPELLSQGHNDLVLFGLKETGFLKQIFLGSTITRIAEELNHTIVAIPETVHVAVPEKLVVAVNYLYPLNEGVFANVLNIFKSTIRSLEFITVITTEDAEAESSAYLNRLREQYGQTVPASFRTFTGTDTFSEIKTYMNQSQNSNSVLVVQKGSRHLTDQFFRKFLVNELVHDGSIPLIILPQ